MAIVTRTNGRGGYDYSFVNTPSDELVCKICHHPSREPYLSVCCGHTFCKTCLEDAKQAVSVEEEVKNACPMCREKNFTSFPNKQNERAIKNLHVFCTNKDKGCNWQGEINSIVGHLTNHDGCPFEEVSCTNKCGWSLQRQHLSKHVDTECTRSKVTCQYCNAVGERQFIIRLHQNLCPKFPLPCPNKCKTKTVPRRSMNVHRAKCPLEMIRCKCNLSLQRQHLSKHVDTECPRSKVTCQYCNTIGERQFISGYHHQKECPKLPLPCPNKCEVGTVLRENMKMHRAECPLEMIWCACGLFLQRQHVSKHVDTKCSLSKVTCQYCNTIGERQFISRHHKEQCPKFPLSCPNKCEVGTVLRENMEAHRAECPLETIQCEYYEVGCKDSMHRKDQVKHNKGEIENHLSLMKSEYLHTKGKLTDTEQIVASTKSKLAAAEERIRELESAMEHRNNEVEIQLQQKIQLVENMMFKHIHWYTTLEGRVKSQYTKPAIPVTLKVSEYSKKKGSDSDWYTDGFSWELSVFDQHPEMKLRITPGGYDDCKGTHLSIQLYVVKGGRKIDFTALECQKKQSLRSTHSLKSAAMTMYFGYTLTETKSREERVRQRERLNRELEKEIEELREKQKLWEKNSLAHLNVMMLNQITDSEHYSVQTNQIDLNASFFTNEDCNVLIFDSPCFVSNEVLYKSTATCQYLKDDNIYFLIKAA